MGRFNIRPRYGANEPTGGERISGSISDAIGMYMNEQESRRTEENAMRAGGGTPVGSPPGMRDRWNGVKNSVSRVFGRGGPTTAFTDETRPTAPQPSQPSLDIGPRGVTPPPMAGRRSVTPIGSHTQPSAPMGTPAQPSSSIGAAIGRSLDPTDLSYEQTARGGQRYRFDPMRGEKAKLALVDQRKHTDEQEEIDALTSTGQWTPAQAAARVRGKLAYGEEFGRTRQANQLTFQQRQELVDRTNRGRVQVARIMADGRQNTAEGKQAIQQQILDLREAALAMQAAGLDATGYENTAKALEGQIPKGTDAIVAGATPAGKEQIARTTRAAGAARDSAVSIRKRGAAVADSVLHRGDGSGKKPVADRDAELKAQGKTADERRRILAAEGYKVR